LDGTPPKPPSFHGQTKEFAKGQNKPTFYFNQPPAAAPPVPLTLLHPIFGQFVDDCDSYIPTKEEYNLVCDLSLTMSEEDRMSKFHEVMNKHGFDLKTSTIEGTSYRTDGDTRVGKLCIVVVEEVPSHCSREHVTT
jgi:hypothetical protein